MNNLIRLFIAFLIITTQLFSQWIEQSSNISDELVDVCFVDSLYGWTISKNGKILNTTDGGTNWNIQYQDNAKPDFLKIKFFDQKFGMLTLKNGIIAKTTNGGNNWIFDTLDYSHNFNDLYILNSDTIWLVGESDSSLILKTVDGGEIWNLQFQTKHSENLDPPPSLKAITFIDANNGWVIAEDFCFDYCTPTHIYNTVDGGENWNYLSSTIVNLADRDSVPVNTANGILTDKNRNVWLYGIDGIVVSYDSGNNWLHNESEQKNSVLKLCSIKKDILYSLNLGGQDGNGIYYSSNQGNDWKEIYKNNSSILLSISCTEQGLLWAVGKEGRILKYNGEITEVNELSKNYDSFKLYQNYPNPFNSSTNINFILEKKTEVKLDIYNVNGEKIKTIINNYKQPGNYSIIWDGKNNKGEMVSSGIYYYRLIQINNSKTKKMILLQ